MAKNSVVHFEMAYEDPKRVSEFYSKTFGWDMKEFGPEMGNYVLAQTTETDDNNMVKTPGAINGGFYEKKQMQGNQPVHVVINVDDLEEALKKVEEAGGKKITEPIDIPGIGNYATIVDTEGNNVGVLEPAPMT